MESRPDFAKRLTYMASGKYKADSTSLAVNRLAVYENLHEQLICDSERLTAELAALRAAGKEKTARHRDLLSQKLCVVYALSPFNSIDL